ncbi:hypothetical protein EJB05_12797, partial [Eragrostis curvula]
MLLSQAQCTTHGRSAPLLVASNSPRRRVRLLPPPPCHGAAEEHTHGGAAASAAESLPRHVAVVMDGNGRWSRARGLPMEEGHRAGQRALERTVRLSRASGVRALTAFAFSHENLSRPKAEVDYLMRSLEAYIHDNVDEFSSEGVRLHVIGDSPNRPAFLLKAAREACEATSHNSDLIFMLAIGYSGRRDIVQACRGLADDARRGRLRPDDIDDARIAGRLATSVAGNALACPDLLVRTSGEQRLRNFLLWQSAYSELYFTDTMWPDFDEGEYLKALASYQTRDRRFGKRKS